MGLRCGICGLRAGIIRGAVAPLYGKYPQGLPRRVAALVLVARRVVDGVQALHAGIGGGAGRFDVEIVRIADGGQDVGVVSRCGGS